MRVDVKIFFIGDTRGFNLLSIASESGDVEAVKTLLNLGFDVHNNVDGKTAIMLAYDKRYFAVVLELLKNHSLFPENFSIEGVSDELKAFIELNKLMHKNIQDKNKEMVLEILTGNQTQKFFYDLENNSAMTCAVINKAFEIYEVFLMRNFFFGPHENYEEIFGFFENDENVQKKFRKIHEKHSKPLLAPHLMILLSNSSIGFDNENDTEKIGAVALAFRTLDANRVLSQILKVVAAKKNFKIIFDFERDSVSFLDPSVEGYASGLFYTSGKILIGAQDLMIKGREHEAYGTIIHECCHYALLLTFDNVACPYYKVDAQSQSEFDRVINDCERKIDREEIVAWALEHYPEEMIPAEIAVRYAHMLGHYHNQPEKIEELTETFELLKNYHEEKVMPAMDDAIARLERSADINKKYLNAEKKISVMKYIIWALLSSLVVLLVCVAVIYFFAQSPKKVWKDLNNKERILIKNTFVDYFGTKVMLGDLFVDDNATAFKVLSANQIDLALRNDSRGLNEAFNRTIYHEVVLTWKNCPDNIKQKILKSKVNFQGKEIELGKILDYDSTVLLEFSATQIKNLIEDQIFEVGSTFSSEIKFFIERLAFVKSNDSFLSRNSDSITPKTQIFLKNDVIYESIHEGIFLLIDGPGDGKSTYFKTLPESIKMLHPQFFVAFVNLKEHLEFYEDPNKDTKSLIGKKILKLHGLELSIFKELYLKGKVALVWDAFDEVPMKFHSFLLNIFREIKTRTKNLQFLSSRPEHEQEISNALSAKVFSLMPFDDENREEFFEEQLKDVKNREKIKEKILKFVEISESRSVQPINNPLMLGIIANVLKTDQTLDLNNRFKIYETFVDQQIESIKDFSRLRLLAKQGLTFYEIHQRYALSQYFYQTLPKVVSLDIFRRSITLTPVEATSFGLLILTSDGSLEFIHRSFLEFFVAHYLADKVFNMTETTSVSEFKLRTDTLIYLVENLKYFTVVKAFLFSYLQHHRIIENWNQNNIENARKSFLYTKSNYKNWQLSTFLEDEIFRRLLMKDFQTFQRIINDLFGNVYVYVERQIYSVDTDTKYILAVSNNKKLIFEGYTRDGQKGNILYKIWDHLRNGYFSWAFVLNKVTEINLNENEIDRLGEQKTFSYFFDFVSQNLTRIEKKKMIKSNFYDFLGDYEDNDEFNKRLTILTSVIDDEEIKAKLKEFSFKMIEEKKRKKLSLDDLSEYKFQIRKLFRLNPIN